LLASQAIFTKPALRRLREFFCAFTLRTPDYKQWFVAVIYVEVHPLQYVNRRELPQALDRNRLQCHSLVS
jgi:hypothetical protein